MQKLIDFYKKNKLDVITGGVAAIIISFIIVMLVVGPGESSSYEEETTSSLQETSEDIVDSNGVVGGEDESIEKSTTSFTYVNEEKRLYTTDGLRVRNLPNTDGEVIGGLEEGSRVYTTGRCNETGWYRINYGDEVGYVCHEYLTENCPVEAPSIVGQAAILYDVDTGEILYEKDADKKMYPASLTKIMTTLLACERGKLDEQLTFSENCKAVPYDSSVYGVRIGETVTVRDSLYMLMLVSANDVGVGIAEHISGTEAEFAKLMTKRAKELGANNTSFANAHGYHHENHYTTARDLMFITLAGLKNEDFVDVWQALEYTVPATNKVARATEIKNIHRMLRSDMSQYYRYAIGGKTGFTDDAGRCSVTTAKKNGRTLLCVVLKSDKANQYKDAELLFEYGFTYK